MLSMNQQISTKFIGENVSLLLRVKDIRPYQLAYVLKQSPSNISGKLRGKVSWSAVDIAKTAEYLDVSSDQLLGLKPLTVTVD